MKRYDLTGQRFGRLVAIKYVPSNKRRERDGTRREGKWLCACDCGMTTMVCASDLVHGRTQSCGCLHDEATGNRARKHSGALPGRRERLYTIWCAMKQRCYYNKSQSRKNYSMKGITVCDEWLHDYAAFRDWSYANGYREQEKCTKRADVLSIDRIDPRKGYSPDNCQWISFSKNAKKRFEDERQANQTGSLTGTEDTGRA